MGAPGPTGDDWQESDWRLVAESIPHMVWVAAPTGRTLYFNQQGVDYTGAPGHTVTWEDLVHPDDIARSKSCWDEALRTKSGFDEDFRIRRFDGVYLWHNSRSRPLLDADGGIARWIGTATEIDDRKRLEHDLVTAHREAAEAATLLATLQDAAPVAFGFVDLDHRVVRLNQAMATAIGAPIEELVGQKVGDNAPELWGQLEPIFRHVADTGESVRNVPFESRFPETPAAQRELLTSFYPVQIDGETVGVGVISLDVTDRLRAERFRSAVMSQVADGVYTQDTEGRLTYMNRAASKMLGWAEEDLCGRSVHDVVHVQRTDGSPAGAACELLTEGTDHRLVHVAAEAFTRKDGSTFPVAYSTMPLSVGSQTEGVAVIFRDISDPGSSTNLIRVLVADADTTSSDAITAMLTRNEGMEVVAVATSGAAAVEQSRNLRPDVVIVDVGLPDVGGAATARRIKIETPATSVILTALDYDETAVAGAIAAGCAGVVDKRRAWVELAGAVRAAYQGETTISQEELQQVVTSVRDSWSPGRAEDLTAREREVLLCLTLGLSNQQVATRLGVALNTVRNHVQRILYKLDVHSRLEAVVLATRDGMFDELL